MIQSLVLWQSLGEDRAFTIYSDPNKLVIVLKSGFRKIMRTISLLEVETAKIDTVHMAVNIMIAELDRVHTAKPSG